jgi:hypothetical protein
LGVFLDFFILYPLEANQQQLGRVDSILVGPLSA